MREPGFRRQAAPLGRLPGGIPKGTLEFSTSYGDSGLFLQLEGGVLSRNLHFWGILQRPPALLG